jgi:hypothetical protein
LFVVSCISDEYHLIVQVRRGEKPAALEEATGRRFLTISVHIKPNLTLSEPLAIPTATSS